MKWWSGYAGCPEVAGKANWATSEEYVPGERTQITASFIRFTGDAECIRFRSRVFLQAERYSGNALIREAIERHDSDRMAEGLKDAGWATDSSYVESLKSIMHGFLAQKKLAHARNDIHDRAALRCQRGPRAHHQELLDRSRLDGGQGRVDGPRRPGGPAHFHHGKGRGGRRQGRLGRRRGQGRRRGRLRGPEGRRGIRALGNPRRQGDRRARGRRLGHGEPSTSESAPMRPSSAAISRAAAFTSASSRSIVGMLSATRSRSTCPWRAWS